MEVIAKRNELISNFIAFGKQLLDAVKYQELPFVSQGGIIDAKYSAFKNFAHQLSSSTRKAENVQRWKEKYMDENLTQDQIRAEHYKMTQVLQELEVERRELERFDISDVKRLKETYKEVAEELQARLDYIDRTFQDAVTKNMKFKRDFEQTSSYIRERLANMSLSERQQLEPQFREQEERMFRTFKELGDLVDGLGKRWHQTYDAKLDELDLLVGRATKLEVMIRDEKEQQARNVQAVQETMQSLAQEQPEESQVAQRYVPRLDQPPVVRIFEIEPAVFDPKERSFRRIQQSIATQLREFTWSVLQSEHTTCHLNELNRAQKIAYHALHPYNGGVNAVLVHSTGSGKTGTGRLILSLFARAGYDIVTVAPIKIQGNLTNEAFHAQADFNVQQYTRGKDLEDTILQDILQKSRNKDLQTVDDVKKVLESRRFAKTELLALSSTSPSKKTKKPERKAQDDEEGEIISDYEYNLKTYLFEVVLQDHMQMRQYTTPLSTLTYEQLSNLTKGAKKTDQADNKHLTKEKGSGLQQVTDFFINKSKYGAERTIDLLYKVMIVVDEGHNLVAENSSLKPRERPNYKRLRDMLYVSYRLKKANPEYECARILFLTATPVVHHPLDAVNLALLTHLPDEDIGFDEYWDIDTNRAKTEREFMEKEYDPITGKFKREEKLKELFAGHFSYVNMLGDIATTPQPILYENGKPVENPNPDPVQYVPVILSTVQIGEIANCIFGKKGGANIEPRKGVEVEQRTNNAFVFVERTQQLTVSKNLNAVKVKSGARARTKRDEIPSDDNAFECVNRNITWPWIHQSEGQVTAKQLIDMDMSQVRELVSSGRLREFSPLIDQLIKGIKRKQDHAFKSLHEYYRTLDALEEKGLVEMQDPESRLRNYKQFVFVDTRNDEYGVLPIAKILEATGFERLSDSRSSRRVTERSSQLYKGFSVLDSKTTKEDKEQIVKAWNSAQNVDGRQSLIMLVNGQYKEGLSLSHVRYEHIAGLVRSDEELRQPIARGVRTCSRVGTPFIPGQGWTIDITVYTPAFPAAPGSNPLYPLELMEMLDPSKNTIVRAKEEMMRLIRETAFDRDLLRSINDASEAAQDAVQLWPGRRAK